VSLGGRAFSELRNMSNSTPSIVPTDDRTVYLVLDDFVDLGQCWRETAIEGTDFETVINDLLGGEYYNPVRVIGFNTAEGWSRDVSGDVAYELRRRCALQLRELPQNILEFVQQHEPRTNRNQQQLVRLVIYGAQSHLGRMLRPEIDLPREIALAFARDMRVREWELASIEPSPNASLRPSECLKSHTVR